MTIFEVIKAIKRGYWYKIPHDVHASAYIAVDHIEAASTLTHFRNHWHKQGVNTTFEMSEPILIPVWDKDQLKNVERTVITVVMRNSEIDKMENENYW